MEQFKYIFIIIALILCREQACLFPTKVYAQEADKVYRLSLHEISRLAVENNFEIQMAKYDTLIAQTDHDGASSMYDTLFRGQVSYQKDKSKNASVIAGSNVTSNDYNIGLSQKLPTGTDLLVDLTNDRTFTDSSFSTAPLTHESNLKFTIEQDLGKNFFGIQDRGDIKITRLDADNKQYTSLDKIEMSLADTQKAYWDLVLARERVIIEEEMVEQAQKLYKLHQEQLDDGLVEVPDAIASEVNYRKRKNELILTRNDAKSKLNILKLLLNQTDKSVMIEPTDTLNLPVDLETFKDSLRSAFDNRRDYKAAYNDIQKYQINLFMKKNNLWPEINLTASLARNGFGDHFKQSVETITTENNPDFFAGITVEFPIMNTLARAQLKAAELEKAKSLVALKLVENRIAVGILNQVRNCQIFMETAQNTEAIAELEQQRFQEELKRFRRGRSSTDTLIRIQEDYILSRFLATQAKYRYHTAVIDLKLIEASLLEPYWNERL